MFYVNTASQKFCNILAHDRSGSSRKRWLVVGALTLNAFLQSVRDSEAAQMSVQPGLFLELMLYKFKQSHNTVEAAKNICCSKGDGAINHRTVTR